MYYLVSHDDNTNGNKSIVFSRKKLSMSGLNSRSSGFRTKQELIDYHKVLDKPCVKCNGVVSTNYTNGEILVSKNLCFTCNHFDEVLQSNDSRYLIIKGNVYYRKNKVENPDNKSFLGFSGHLFKIKTFKGEYFETNNLWNVGQVPIHFKNELVDNAEFIKEENRLNLETLR